MIEFLYKYGIISAFIIVMLEYACFPIPSEVVLPWVGSMVVICNYSFAFIWMLCNLAGLSGCLLCYFVGSILSNRIERKFKCKKWYIKTLNFLDRKHNLSICVGRLIPLYRTYISLISGIKKHNVLKFSFFSFIGICIWNACLIYLGYYFYNNLDMVASFYSKYKMITIVILAIIIFITLYKKIKIRSVEKKCK